MTYSVAITAESEAENTQAGAETEKFNAKIALAAASSDFSMALGGLTDPKYIVIFGAQGVSFKLGSDTTGDSIGANPVAYIADDDDGLNIDTILLSNTDAQEHSVRVLAAE